MFEGFEQRDIETSETMIHARIERLGTAFAPASWVSPNPRDVAPGSAGASRAFHCDLR